MKFPRLYEKVFTQPWAVTLGMHASIRTVLFNRILGIETPRAFFGDEEDPEDPDPEEARKPYALRNGVAVITVDGILGAHLDIIELICGGCSIEGVRGAIDAAEKDEQVSRIVLAFHSPGGTVTGIPELAERIAQVEKPISAFTDSLMASAAYWLASQCDEVWVTPSSATGSIGVYLALLDQTVAMQLEGLRLELFKAGEHKGIGLPGRELSQSDRELLQASVDKTYGWFTSAVKAKRPSIQGDSMQGQTFDGEESVARGLADGTVGSLDDLLAAMAGLKG